MAERLIIQNFAGLDIDIELGRINLFIGPQASGKSVCAKCLYLFRSFIPSLFDSASQAQDRKIFDATFLNNFREYFPNLWKPGINFRLRYELNKEFVEITSSDKDSSNISLSYSTFLQNSAVEMRNIVRQVRDSRQNDKSNKNRPIYQMILGDFFATNEYRHNAEKHIGQPIAGRQSFVIAGRAFLSTLKGSILTVLANNPIADPSLRDFLQLYERVKQRYTLKFTPVSAYTNRLIEAIIRGRILIEKDEEYIQLPDTRRIPLANASSGQQEAFSLLTILLDLLEPASLFHDGKGSALYAEEPEAHLFPESQRMLARLMARIYNTTIDPVQYVITTHSPYLLASFNNLVYAQQIEESLGHNNDLLKKLNKIVPKNERLPLLDFRAYQLENGKARPIINKKLGLLSADSLDNASNKINQQFGKLTELDPSTHY